MPQFADYVPTDYASARSRFRAEIAAHRGSIEAHAVPGGNDLTIDVARLGPTDAQNLVIVSGGLHGGEGPFGSAVQFAVLDAAWPDNIALLLIHALNPFGYANYRRVDADNVDLNRNFLLQGDSYTGCPPHFDEVDPLLCPLGPPRLLDLSFAKLWWLRWRLGERAIRRAIASGQYVNPEGLFYGGRGPSPTQQILAANLPRWVGPARCVIHLDFHTGLGPRSTHKILMAQSPGSLAFERWHERFGAAVESGPTGETAYPCRGGIDEWMVAQFPDIEFDSACAEFGTTGPIRVLSTLRYENLAWHGTPPGSTARRRAARRMREAFVPHSMRWREQVVRDGMALVLRAAEVLRK